MATHPGSRRVLRDLVPATLATGAAALVVTLLVGGATADVRGTLMSGGGRPATAVAELAGTPGVAGALAAADLTVRVRPSLPAPIRVVSVLDLLPPDRAPRPPGPSLGARGAGRDRPAVRPPTSAPVAASTAVLSVVPAAVASPGPTAPTTPTTPAPDLVTEPDSPSTGRTAARTPTWSKGKPRSSTELSLASTGAVALSPSSGPASSAPATAVGGPVPTDQSDPGHGPSDAAPPPHATAHGRHRTR